VDLDDRAPGDAVNILDDAAFNGDNDFFGLHCFPRSLINLNQRRKKPVG
jgi:hypothetical protein